MAGKYKSYEKQMEAVAEALLNGATKKEAAAIGDVSVATVYNWIAKDKEFKEIERRMARAKLLPHRGKALDVYIKLLECERYPKYQLEAANKINEILGWESEEDDVQQELKIKLDFGSDDDDSDSNNAD